VASPLRPLQRRLRRGQVTGGPVQVVRRALAAHPPHVGRLLLRVQPLQGRDEGGAVRGRGQVLLLPVEEEDGGLQRHVGNAAEAWVGGSMDLWRDEAPHFVMYDTRPTQPV